MTRALITIEADREERAKMVGRTPIPTAIRKTRLTNKSTSRLTKRVEELNERLLQMNSNR